MRPLSTSQAIAPAFGRTRLLLYRPFQWSSHLKLTLVAVATSGLLLNFRYTLPGALAIELPPIPAAFQHASGFVILAVIAALLAIDLVILFFYFMARLRFALFHSLVEGSRSLGPEMKIYEREAGRFFRAKIAVWLGIAGLAAAVVVVAAIVVLTVANLRTPEGKYDTGVFLVLFFPALGFLAFVVILSLLAQIVVNDFMLPHIALEGASPGEAWRAVRTRMRADREAFFSYFLFRVLILIMVAPVLAGLGFVLLWPVFWILGASATGYAALFDEASGLLGGIRIGASILFAVLAVAAGVAGSAVLGGPLVVFLRAHALYFYGSRFAPLGKRLYPKEAEAGAPVGA
ncbi:MAG TPA: hypothetical protein VG267_19770 [Terracidiphilus sp.]|nr:hypothetical protein [Terracidiphilus sp.]